MDVKRVLARSIASDGYNLETVGRLSSERRSGYSSSDVTCVVGYDSIRTTVRGPCDVVMDFLLDERR